jgi:ribosome-associated heat shock protein Hsp15
VSVQEKISTEPGARQRIDKWLWVARFFKTRSQAADAVGKGRVRIGGATVKPAREVRIGEQVEIAGENGAWQVEVRGVCELRGPAAIAQMLYEETEAGRSARLAEQQRRRDYREPASALHGRPTKRDRRLIGRLQRDGD